MRDDGPPAPCNRGTPAALVLDLPLDELTWYTRPQEVSGVLAWLELEKAPVEWYLRPRAWPVANHYIRRPLRIWSPDGPDTVALDALQRGEAEQLRMAAPTGGDQRAQLVAELAASLAHSAPSQGRLLGA